MKRRYALILGALSLTLAAMAYYTIRVQASVSEQLEPFYQSDEFSDRDQIEFMALQQLTYVLDDFEMWLVLAATVPAIVILIVWMLSTRRVSQ